MKKIICLLGSIVLLGLCLPVMAADGVAGKWESEREGRQGQGTMKTTYEFQVSGTALTGKILSNRGGNPTETPISEGKIAGDTITFTVVRSFGDNEMKQKYTGKVAGDQITFTMEMEGGFGGMGGPPGGGAMGGPPTGGPPAGGAGPPGGGAPRGPRDIIAKRVK